MQRWLDFATLFCTPILKADSRRHHVPFVRCRWLNCALHRRRLNGRNQLRTRGSLNAALLVNRPPYANLICWAKSRRHPSLFMPFSSCVLSLIAMTCSAAATESSETVQRNCLVWISLDIVGLWLALGLDLVSVWYAYVVHTYLYAIRFHCRFDTVPVADFHFTWFVTIYSIYYLNCNTWLLLFIVVLIYFTAYASCCSLSCSLLVFVSIFSSFCIFLWSKIFTTVLLIVGRQL